MNLEAEKLVYNAGQLLADRKAGEAASLLQECILRFPNEGKAHGLMGYICHVFFREPFTAEEHFSKAMLLAPDYTETYIYYAEALLLQERYTEMTAVLNKALETTGADKSRIYFLFGQMNEKQSKYEEAVEQYQRSIIHSLDDASMQRCTSAIARCVSKQKTFSI